jgi:hypothetical protein
MTQASKAAGRFASHLVGTARAIPQLFLALLPRLLVTYRRGWTEKFAKLRMSCESLANAG